MSIEKTTKRCLNILMFGKQEHQRLNDIAADLQYTYSEALDCYYDMYGKDPYWWLINLTSRNLYADDSFYKLCLFKLITEKIECESYDEVILDSPEVAQTVKKYIKKKKLRIDVKISDRNDEDPEDSVYNLLKKVFRILRDRLLSMRISPRTIPRLRLESPTPREIDVLAVDILLCSRIDGDRYDNRYCANMYDYYDGTLYCTPEIVNNTSDKRRVIEKKINGIKSHNFVFLQNYIRWYDYFKYISYHIYCNRLMRKKFFLLGDDVSPIIKASIHKSGMDYRTISTYIAMRRLASAIPIRKAIIWYEARPIDFAFSLALRDANVNINRVGYISYPLSEFMLGQSPTSGQVRNRVTPDVISVPGEAYKSVIIKFCLEQKVIIVPSFRRDIKNEDCDKNRNINTLLVVMSYFRDESQKMLGMINEYCKRHETDINIHIKMHPVHAEKRVDYYIKDELYFTPKYVTGSIGECLKDASMAFTSASSSSMDIILSGTYLICLNRLNTLENTCIAPGVGKDRYSMVYDEDDFCEAMRRVDGYYNNPKKSDIDENDFFVPLNKETAEVLFD